MNQQDLIAIYRIFHPTTAEQLFVSTHEAFTKIDYILGHKTSLNKFKRIEIIWGMFSDHNGTKPAINSRKFSKKIFKHFEIKQHTSE